MENSTPYLSEQDHTTAEMSWSECTSVGQWTASSWTAILIIWVGL